MKRPRCIVVAIDFSDHSLLALEQAIALARRFGARLHLVHSTAIPMHGVMPYDLAVPDSIWDGIREAAGQKLAELREKAEAQGVEATAEVSPELPAEAVVAAAHATDAELVVMGTRGRTGLRHALLGSVAERTLRTAPCSVLTVREPER